MHSPLKFAPKKLFHLSSFLFHFKFLSNFVKSMMSCRNFIFANSKMSYTKSQNRLSRSQATQTVMVSRNWQIFAEE